MILGKSREEVARSIENRLRQNTLVTDLDPGTIAKAFCDVLAHEFGDFYRELELTTTMGFVSTARGEFLDLIGELLNCRRMNSSESDANYRSRIVNQVYVVAGANQTAIRLRALSVPGVQDIILREFAKGAGSFAVYIITDELEPPQSVIDEVEAVIQETKAAGILAEVKTPILIPVEVKVRLIFNESVSDAEKATIRQAATTLIKDYIDNIPLGGTFVVNEIITNAMSASNKIIDVDFYSLKVEEATLFVRNFHVNWDERIVISKLEVL